ncbi:mitochondrial ribosomal protein S24 [Dermatophagoides farinae]|uniref:mitochondrial ribosomal protein S24 n=1 Tax=Dermatophagoides farinae TaxID=6954 RepID=UPI003F5F0CED
MNRFCIQLKNSIAHINSTLVKDLKILSGSPIILYNPSRQKCQAGRYKVTLKRNRPLTYEQANKPSYIGVRKGWNSWNTSSLPGVSLTSEVSIDDAFIRKFIAGTWHRLFLSEVIIKRRGNMIHIGGIVNQAIPVRKYYWLIGYTEELLSHLLKCPVKIDVQTTADRNALIYKYI